MRLLCESLKFWPKFPSLSPPRSYVAIDFSILVASLYCSMQSFVATLRSCVLLIICCDNVFLLRHYSFFSIITLSQHSFSVASAIWCHGPSFHVATAFPFRFCYIIVSCIIRISIATQKVCCDRVLLPLSLTSCCGFFMMLRHGFLMLSIIVVATWFSCHKKTFLYAT